MLRVILCVGNFNLVIACLVMGDAVKDSVGWVDLFGSGDFSTWIRVNGNKLEHWLNGKKVVSLEIGADQWTEQFERSKYR